MKFVRVIAGLTFSIIVNAAAIASVPKRIYFEDIGAAHPIIREIRPDTSPGDQINYINGVTFKEARFSILDLKSTYSDDAIKFDYTFRAQQQPCYYNWDGVNHFPERQEIVRGGEDIMVDNDEKIQIINICSDTVQDKPISIRVANKICITDCLMSTPRHIDIYSLVENSLISQIRVTPRPYKYKSIDQFYISQTCVLTTDINFKHDYYSFKVCDADVEIFFNHRRMQQLGKDQNEFCDSFLN